MSAQRLMDDLTAAWAVLSREPAGLITDVDGTISPIVERPEEAGIHPEARGLLGRLSSRLPLVAAVSGRPIEHLVRVLGVEGMVFVGNHGLEWWEQGRSAPVPEAEPYLSAVSAALSDLRARLGSLPGVFVEDKGVSGAVHYRQAPDREVARRAVLDAISQSPSARVLQAAEGRMVVNILPPIRADKGTAVERLVRHWELRGALYLGDDVTDLDAFRALREIRAAGQCLTLSVAVVSPEAPAELEREADCTVASVDEVIAFFQRTLDWLEGAPE
jgi:trehalose 6-phosphate phosphatase